jgi:hypothetical protein
MNKSCETGIGPYTLFRHFAPSKSRSKGMKRAINCVKYRRLVAKVFTVLHCCNNVVGSQQGFLSLVIDVSGHQPTLFFLVREEIAVGCPQKSTFIWLLFSSLLFSSLLVNTFRASLEIRLFQENKIVALKFIFLKFVTIVSVKPNFRQRFLV